MDTDEKTQTVGCQVQEMEGAWNSNMRQKDQMNAEKRHRY